MKYETLRNGMANLLGGALPVAVVIFTTPYVVNTLGASDYGLLTLITAITGYFAILDLQFRAGSLKYVAEYHAGGLVVERDQTLSAGFLLYLLIGVVGSALIFLLADFLVRRVFLVPEISVIEAVQTLELAALAFFFGQLQQYLSSVPQSLRRYDQSAVLETIFGSLAPMANVVVLWMGGGLFEIVAVRVVLSIINLIALLGVIRKLLPDFVPAMPSRVILSKLVKFSGFAYMSGLAWLSYAQGDKLILGAMTSMAAVTYYAVPFMIATRIYLLTFRLSAVLLPATSALSAVHETAKLRELYLYSARYIFYVQCALSILLIVFSREILHYWIGPEMAAEGSVILILIAFANLADSLTNAPSLVNDGLGNPKITGLFSIARAMMGLLAAFLLVYWMGVRGAAIAQLLVFTIYAIALLGYVHGRTIPVLLSDYLRVVVAPGIPLVGAMLASLWVMQQGAVLSITATAMLLLAVLAVVAIYGYLFVMRKSDMQALYGKLARRNEHAKQS